jgi:hypothetical protein
MDVHERERLDGEESCVAAHAGDCSQAVVVARDFGTFSLAIVRDVLGDEDASG